MSVKIRYPAGVLDVDVYKSALLKHGVTDEVLTETFSTFQELVDQTFGLFGSSSAVWAGDGAMFLFPTPSHAIQAALHLLGKLSEFNEDSNRLKFPIFVRIGIHLIERDHPDRLDLPDAHPALDQAGHLQKACPIARIAISQDAYATLGPLQPLFRPSPVPLDGQQFFVLTSSADNPDAERLLQGVSAEQRKLIPPIPFSRWEWIQPGGDTSLTDLGTFFSEKMLIVLAESSRDAGNSLPPGATSDAVGVMEVLASMATNQQVRVGIDEWEDTGDLVSDRNVVIVGSGIVNLYARVINDLIEPLHFAKSEGRVYDEIVASGGANLMRFGQHGRGHSNDLGLVVIAKSPFNIDRHLLWIAGITGIGTQTAARFLFEMLHSPRSTVESRMNRGLVAPIACLIKARAAEAGDGLHIKHYYKRWRVRDYEVIWAMGQSGKVWTPK